MNLIGAESSLAALHLDSDDDGVQIGVETVEDGESGDGETAEARNTVWRSSLNFPGREQLHRNWCSTSSSSQVTMTMVGETRDQTGSTHPCHRHLVFTDADLMLHSHLHNIFISLT